MMHGPRDVSRRALLGAAVSAPAAGWLLAGCGDDEQPRSDAGEVQRVRVNTGLGLFQGREAYLTVGEQLGFFAEEGIELELIPGEGTETNLTQLAAGDVDIATIDVNAGMIAFADGTFTDFVLTAVLHTQLLGCVMVLESSEVARPRDLAGTVMGVIAGGTNTVLFPAWARLVGLDPDTVEFVAPAPPSFGALLAERQVDAVQQFVLAQASLEHEIGQPLRVFRYADALPELYGSALGCSRQMLEEQPRLVRGFNRAALRGMAHAVAHPQEAGEMFASHPRHEGGQPAVAAAAENELLASYVAAEDGRAPGEFDPERLAQSAGILRAAGLLSRPLRAEELVKFDMFS